LTIDNDTLLLLNAYHDGELSPGEALSMERRIEHEPELAALARQLKDLSSGLVDVLPGEPVPERLRGAILASLSVDLTRDNDELRDDGRKRISLRPAGASMATHWRSLAAVLAIGLLGGGLGGGYAVHMMQNSRQAATIEDEILAAHLRALIAPQPFDIASSDNHVVKPWFNGKTTIAPTAPDFAAQGFPLVGGRIDVVDGKPVPVMVYKRRQHTISVTVTASAKNDASTAGVIDGTNLIRWTDAGLTYWAVSDLSAGELSSFATLYQSQLSGGS
jgi:anti-sigma factor RsiW